jgi:hypothetical protein
MGSEPPSDDPRNVWQNQPMEIPRMTMEEIHREKARQLRAKTRRDAIVVPLALIGFAVAMFVMARGTIPRLGCVLAIIWIFLVRLPAVRRAWSRTSPGDAATLSGIEFYRTELRYQLARLRQPWLTTVGPVLLATAAIVMAPIMAVIHKPALAVNMAPFLVLMGVWVFAVFAIIRQQVRQIRLELAELDALERWQRD